MDQSNERSCGAHVTKAKRPFISVIKVISKKTFGTIQAYKGDRNEYAAIYVKEYSSWLMNLSLHLLITADYFLENWLHF